MKLRNIYHWDIKPENILINELNELNKLKFTDFGTAK